MNMAEPEELNEMLLPEPGKGEVVEKGMQIIILILRIIELILAGHKNTDAVKSVAEESGMQFSRLWEKLPGKYK